MSGERLRLKLRIYLHRRPATAREPWSSVLACEHILPSKIGSQFERRKSGSASLLAISTLYIRPDAGCFRRDSRCASAPGAGVESCRIGGTTHAEEAA